jgi:hypothetical protein
MDMGVARLGSAADYYFHNFCPQLRRKFKQLQVFPDRNDLGVWG